MGEGIEDGTFHKYKVKGTYSSEHPAEISFTIALSLAKISDCLNDSLAFLFSLSNETTIYSS